MFDAPHSGVLCAIARHVRQNPDKTALVAGSVRVSYGQLEQKIKSAAAYLQSIGLDKGDHIILAARKELEFVYCYLAAHMLGIVNVVVDPTAPADRLDFIADVTQPAAIFGANVKSDRFRCIDFAKVNTQDDVLSQLAERSLNRDDVADVMFTTGTSGRPKGVCLTHDNLAGAAQNINSFIGNDDNDVEALGLPLSHSFGLGRLRCVLVAGGTMVIVGNFANLKSFFNVIQSERVTGFGMVPAVWQYIKRLSGRRIAMFSNQLRYIEMGSASLPIEDKRLLLELFPTTRLCMHYGLTEASRALFSEFHCDSSNLETIGRPVSNNVEACILDENGNPVADGTDGELCVRGNMVMRSYLLPADNEDAFYGDWFRTGDWAHRDSEGNFYFTGRKKELINVGGEKVSPITIEDAIRSLGIEDCACIAIPDPSGMLGEVPKVFLQQGEKQPDIETLKQQLSHLLPPHEIPIEWELIDKIPRTVSGKIQRLKLKTRICHN